MKAILLCGRASGGGENSMFNTSITKGKVCALFGYGFQT
jgi:hypothetical protein